MIALEALNNSIMRLRSIVHDKNRPHWSRNRAEREAEALTRLAQRMSECPSNVLFDAAIMADKARAFEQGAQLRQLGDAFRG